MTTALFLGDLLAAPVQRQTSAGSRFATATVRTGAGSKSVLTGLATFSESTVDKLLGLKKGDSLAATGVLEMKVWSDREGRERRDWRLTASQVLTVYEAANRRKAAAGQSEEAPFDAD